MYTKKYTLRINLHIEIILSRDSNIYVEINGIIVECKSHYSLMNLIDHYGIKEDIENCMKVERNEKLNKKTVEWAYDE